ncbi:MAG: YihY/virulence factor BrkB family protein [Kiritimatiellia bacterium]
MTANKLKEKLIRMWRFAVGGIWDIDVGSLSGRRSFGVKFVRVIHLIFKGFREDECPLHASALTFSSLMALVPVLALSLALLRGLGGAETAKQMIRGGINEFTRNLHSEAVASGADETVAPSAFAAEIDQVVTVVFEKVENVNFTALGGVGLVLLLWMAVQVLGRVESSFNRVWGVRTGRPMWRKVTDYLSVLLVAPVLIVAASSLSIAEIFSRVFGESGSAGIEALTGSELLGNLVTGAATVLCFTFVLLFMPNTKVNARPALAGGITGAILFTAWLGLCKAVQAAAVTRYGAIYGTFALIPVLLIWMYVSWSIVLFAAEVAFAFQHCTTYRMEQDAASASVHSRIVLALSVMREAARSMLSEERGFDIASFAAGRTIPVRLLNSTVDDLVRTGYLAELSGERGRFVMLKSPEKVTVAEIARTILNRGAGPERLGLTDLEKRVSRAADGAVAEIGPVSNNTTVRELI